MVSGGNRYRFGATFDDVVQECHSEPRWYELNWKAYRNVKTAYVVTAVGSFLLMFVFGALCMKVHNSCLVVDSGGRCCQCLSVRETSPVEYRQGIPREGMYNDVYYGAVIMMGACFGLIYVYVAISQENRFLFFCIAVTQATEVLRSALDEVHVPPEYDAQRTARRILLGLAGLLMIISWFLVRPVYKMFGWRIFRRGGARRVVRDMYKTYQRYRVCNLLDIQASILLFLVLVFFVQSASEDGYWVLIVVLLCELTASRYAAKYLKREDHGGVVVSAFCKLVAVVWWTMALAEYAGCWRRFQQSRAATSGWWLGAYFPSLVSVAESYAGGECLAHHTAFDSRVVGLLATNYAFAIIFRAASFIIGLRVVRNFGKGMKMIFYVRPQPVAEGSSPDNEQGDVVGEFSDGEVPPQLRQASRPLMDA